MSIYAKPTESQVTGWLNSWPEIATRQKLLAYLQEDPKFRRRLFQLLDGYDQITTMQGRPEFTLYLLALYRIAQWPGLEEWKARIEAIDIYIWNELVGFHRNFLNNLRLAIKPHSKHRRMKQNQFTVVVERKRTLKGVRM